MLDTLLHPSFNINPLGKDITNDTMPFKGKKTELVLKKEITSFLVIIHILGSKRYARVVLAISGFFVLYNHFLKIKVFANWREKKALSFSALLYCCINQPAFLGADYQDYYIVLYSFLIQNNTNLLIPLCEAIAYSLENSNISELASFKSICDFLRCERVQVLRTQLKSKTYVHWFMGELHYFKRLVESFLVEYRSLALPILSDSEIANRLDIYIMTNMKSWLVLSHSVTPFPKIFFSNIK